MVGPFEPPGTMLVSSDETLAEWECLQIPRAVNDPQDLYAIELREIEEENPFEIRYPTTPQVMVTPANLPHNRSRLE